MTSLESGAGWGRALVSFEEHLATSNRSMATCKGYLKHLHWLADGVEPGPWDLSCAELGKWLDGHRWSRDTRRKVLVSIRSFYSWATAEGLVEWAPTAGLPMAAQRSGPGRLDLPPSWVGPVGKYLQWLGAGARSEGTLDQRRWQIGRLAEVSADPWAVSTQQLAVFLSSPDWSPATKRATRSAVRSFYGWAVRTGQIRVSPAADLDVVRVPRALPRPAPNDAVREALAAGDPRVRLAVMLAAYAGLRRAEIASLHTRQISDTEILVIGKGGHERRVPMHRDLRSEVIAHRERARRDADEGRGPVEPGYLFPSSHGGHLTPPHLGKLVAAALPGKWTAHTLRHRFATAAYLVERDLRAVQELLGHSKPESTARYAAVPEGALRTAVDGVGL